MRNARKGFRTTSFFLSDEKLKEASRMRKNHVPVVALALCVAAIALASCAKKNEGSAALGSSDGASPFLQQVRKAGVLKVGSSGDSPFAYIDQASGSFDGIDAEIIKEAAKRMGIPKVEMALIPFSELILNLNNSNIDIIADCMYTRADRAEKVYFGDIWYTQGGGLLAAEGNGINGQKSFNPQKTRVGYTAGTVCRAERRRGLAEVRTYQGSGRDRRPERIYRRPSIRKDRRIPDRQHGGRKSLRELSGHAERPQALLGVYRQRRYGRPHRAGSLVRSYRVHERNECRYHAAPRRGRHR